jgi:thiamine-phosphate pyrophosphorylase
VPDENLTASLGLLAVTDDRVLAGRDAVAACLAAARGGATAIQLRLKRASARELAEAARALLDRLDVPLFLDDRLDVALAVGASGVHLGPGDFPVVRARRIAPPGFVVGASVGDEAEARAAGAADYWGIGPWRATGTKADAGAPLGAAGFRALVALAGGRPCVAIGGIEPGDVEPVRRAGGAGVAVVSGIFGQPDIEAAARRYRISASGAEPRSPR